MRRRASNPASTTIPPRRLGMAVPTPFVGRTSELAALEQALTDWDVIVVRGPIGVGKTRLVKQFVEDAAVQRQCQTAWIPCFPNDRAVAVRARIERAMGVLPGEAAHGLCHEAHLIVLDDIHHLSDGEAAALVGALVAPANPDAAAVSAGRLIISGRVSPALDRLVQPFVLDLKGLSESDGRDLWSSLESMYGPTRQGACDRALLQTRGLPLALRRSYATHLLNAETAAGSDAVCDAWDIHALSTAARAALETLAIARIPLCPAAMCSLAHQSNGVPRMHDGDVVDEEFDVVIAELGRRQLIDATDDGRLYVHDVVRAHVVATMETMVSGGGHGGLGHAHRQQRERAAAALLASDQGPHYWTADSGLEPMARLREQVHHLCHAGDIAVAIARIEACWNAAMRRGGSGEILALLDILDDLTDRDHWTTAATPNADADRSGAVPDANLPASGRRALLQLRIRMAAHLGQITQALSQWAWLPAQLPQNQQQTWEPVIHATLLYRSGDVAGARRALHGLRKHSDVDVRCQSTAQLADIALACGDLHEARTLAVGAFERDFAAANSDSRARLHLALAAVESHAGRPSAARAALSRALGCRQLSAELEARAQARQSRCLAREGRIGEAQTALGHAEHLARVTDATNVANEVRYCRAHLLLWRGDTEAVTSILRDLVSGCRARGDEVGALRAESELAWVLARRGALREAAELAAACRTVANRLGLASIAAVAELADAAIDAAEMRHQRSSERLGALLRGTDADADVRMAASRILHATGQGGDIISASASASPSSPSSTGASSGSAVTTAQSKPSAVWADELRDPVADNLARAMAAYQRDNIDEARRRLEEAAVGAERLGRRAHLARALAIKARLALARGDRAVAQASAGRALDAARACGLVDSEALAHLALAALARSRGDHAGAIEEAECAAKLCGNAGLWLLHAAAVEALDALGQATTPDAATATLPASARKAVARLGDDLGLTAARRFLTVSASGAEARVRDACPERLHINDRSLAVDGVREIIVRKGQKVADLRRRSLLKRLLYLFAGAPGQVFSKEAIVQSVWQVDYHPLRHDAALFTNIMRLRRLLGEDGADLIRVSDDGYRFAAPEDFVYVTTAGDQADAAESAKSSA